MGLKRRDVDVSIFGNEVQKMGDFGREGAEEVAIAREGEEAAAKQWV
jgi:hypothetical protein